MKANWSGRRSTVAGRLEHRRARKVEQNSRTGRGVPPSRTTQQAPARGGRRCGSVSGSEHNKGRARHSCRHDPWPTGRREDRRWVREKARRGSTGVLSSTDDDVTCRFEGEGLDGYRTSKALAINLPDVFCDSTRSATVAVAGTSKTCPALGQSSRHHTCAAGTERYTPLRTAPHFVPVHGAVPTTQVEARVGACGVPDVHPLGVSGMHNRRCIIIRHVHNALHQVLRGGTGRVTSAQPTCPYKPRILLFTI